MNDADKEPERSPRAAGPAEGKRLLPNPARAFGPAQREAVLAAVGVTVAGGFVMQFAFDPERAGSVAMLIALGVFYALTAAIALVRLHQRGELRARFRPAGGDLTLGAVTAGGLYGAAHLVKLALAPYGSPREAWVVRLYLQLGDPAAQGRELVSGAVFLLAALEEITWRGLVMRALEGAYGVRRALLISSVLFGIEHAATLIVLADPVAGFNPLIVLAALGCGLVWGAIFARTSRLVPGIFAHALFSWAVVEFPIWRP
jgi:membrane protease YdiL (CAAX protease family)